MAQEHGDPLSFVRGAKKRRWSEVDRLLALALRIHEDSTCSGCGQLLSECMEPAIADFWGVFPAVRCNACTALAVAQERTKDAEHPQALRHIVGLNAGWEEALAAARSERAAADQ